jgi:hypothetical protein
MLISCKSLVQLEKIKRRLLDVFDARDSGEVSCFLNLYVRHDRQQRLIFLHQHRYAAEVVERFGLTTANPVVLPMSRDVQLRRADERSCDGPYSEAVGCLMYLMCCTRPNLAQSLGALAWHVACPTTEHWNAVKKMLRYVQGTQDLGLWLGGRSLKVHGFSDADFAGDVDARRSTTAYIYQLGTGAVSWRSVLQPTVAVSTMEAEYMAAAAAAQEALWLKRLVVVFEVV